ncbi:MAG: CarD family transcriptional regulator [Bilifractor sp.]
MYQKGDYVVYGTNGPCLVTDVTRLHMPGCDGKRKYYVLRPVNSDKSTIYSPVDNDKVSMRKVMDRQTAQSMVDQIPDIDVLVVSSEKFREEQYKEIIRNNDVCECISMIKMLLQRRKKRLEQGRKFTTVDEKYLREAESILCSEFSIALDQDQDTMDQILRSRFKTPVGSEKEKV